MKSVLIGVLLGITLPYFVDAAKLPCDRKTPFTTDKRILAAWKIVQKTKTLDTYTSNAFNCTKVSIANPDGAHARFYPETLAIRIAPAYKDTPVFLGYVLTHEMEHAKWELQRRTKGIVGPLCANEEARAFYAQVRYVRHLPNEEREQFETYLNGRRVLAQDVLKEYPGNPVQILEKHLVRTSSFYQNQCFGI